MLRLDLPRLTREGSVAVDALVPADDPMWEGMDVTFGGAVEVHLRATVAGSGEVVVRGEVRAALKQECRRCLEPVEGRVHEAVTLVFVPADSPAAEDDEAVRILDDAVADLDLGGPVREELILAIDTYVECKPDCKGLCPQCGVNRNTETCSCTDEVSDPRWNALRALKEE